MADKERALRALAEKERLGERALVENNRALAEKEAEKERVLADNEAEREAERTRWAEEKAKLEQQLSSIRDASEPASASEAGAGARADAGAETSSHRHRYSTFDPASEPEHEGR